MADCSVKRVAEMIASPFAMGTSFAAHTLTVESTRHGGSTQICEIILRGVKDTKIIEIPEPLCSGVEENIRLVETRR